jgi:hypothetical protein
VTSQQQQQQQQPPGPAVRRTKKPGRQQQHLHRELLSLQQGPQQGGQQDAWYLSRRFHAMMRAAAQFQGVTYDVEHDTFDASMRVPTVRGQQGESRLDCVATRARGSFLTSQQG